MSQRTGGLTAVCIISIVLGCLGLLAGLGGIVGEAASDQMQGLAKSLSAGAPPEVKEMQEDLFVETQAIAKRWRPVTWPLLGVKIFVALGLLIGGILALQIRAAGRKLLQVTFLLGIAYEVAYTLANSMLQMEVMQATGKIVDRMIESMPAGGPKGGGLEIMRISGMIGIAFTALFAIAWGIFYLVGLLYVGKSNIEALYAAPASEPDTWQ